MSNATTARRIRNANGIGVTTVVTDDATERQWSRQSVPEVPMSPAVEQATPTQESESMCIITPFMPKTAIPAKVENVNRMDASRNERKTRFIMKV